MGFLPIKLMIIIISTFSIFLSFSQHLFDNLQIILRNSFITLLSIIICTKISDVISTIKFMVIVFSL
jgi:hypothetical protein